MLARNRVLLFVFVGYVGPFVSVSALLMRFTLFFVRVGVTKIHAVPSLGPAVKIFCCL